MAADFVITSGGGVAEGIPDMHWYDAANHDIHTLPDGELIVVEGRIVARFASDQWVSVVLTEHEPDPEVA